MLSSMKKPPAHTNHCQLVAVAARRPDANMSSTRPANSTPAREGWASGRLGLERLETGRMEHARDAHNEYESVMVRATSAQHLPDAIFFAFLPRLSYW